MKWSWCLLNQPTQGIPVTSRCDCANQKHTRPSSHGNANIAKPCVSSHSRTKNINCALGITNTSRKNSILMMLICHHQTKHGGNNNNYTKNHPSWIEKSWSHIAA